MEIYKHHGDTVYELSKKKLSNNKTRRILWFNMTGAKFNWRSLLRFWKLSIRPFRTRGGWNFHALIRAPFFRFEKNNAYVAIGLPNHFLQISTI